ncbi:MAG: ABC transporter substrate-binding protein [Albidovulum sp.]|nr:ABC transporter substrate-binding protein [Albidovulum sp.]
MPDRSIPSDRGFSRRETLKGTVAVGALAAASNIAGGISAASAAVQGGPIVLAVPAESNAVNVVAAGGVSNHMRVMVQRSLLMYDNLNSTYAIVPGLAREMPEVLDDGLRFRFQLRDNAYYHDGTKVTAEAVANWINLQIDENHPDREYFKWNPASRLRSVKQAEAIDELTLDVHLKSFNAAQLDWFTDLAYEGIPVEAVKNRANIVDEDLGAGPYKVARRDKGVATIIERFDQFYDPEEGRAPRIGFRPIAEMNARVAALEAGEVDYIDSITPEAADLLRANDNIEVKERKTLYVWFISLDSREAPLNDVRVRQALNYALDKESLIRDVLGGGAERSYSPLSKQFGPMYAGDVVTHYDYDPDKARALLAEAGFADGFKSTIHTNTGRRGQLKPIEMSQFVQANWADVGVEVEIEALEWSAFEGRRRKGEFKIATRGWTPSTGDPDGLLIQNFHSSQIPPTQRNVAFLQDPEVDRLLDEGSGTLEMEKRTKAFVDAQKRIVDLAPWVFVAHEIAFVAHNSELQDYPTVHPSGWGESLTYAWKA